MSRRGSDLISVAPLAMFFLVTNIGLYLFCATRSQNYMQIDPLVSLALFDSRREGLWEGQWLRLIAPNFLHGGLMHIFFNSMSLYYIGPSAEVHYGSSNFGTIYLLSGISGICFSQIFGGYPALGASAAIFGLLGAELSIRVLKAPVLKYAWRNSEVRQAAFQMLIYFLIGLSGMMGRVDNWAHLGGFLVGAMLGAFFELWRTRHRVGFGLVLGVFVLVGALVGAARCSFFNPYYHVHQAVLAKDEHRDSEMEPHFAEARKWAKIWHNEDVTEFFIYWTKANQWTRERALVSTYRAVAERIRQTGMKMQPIRDPADDTDDSHPL